MSTRQRKGMKAIAIFVAFAVAQISIQLSVAGTVSPSYAALVQQQLVVRINTSGNRPILVNGNSTASGGSLATGATIETPDGTSATIDLGPLGTLDLEPNSKVVLDFDCPPAPPAGTEALPCKVKVKVFAGCMVLKTKKGTEGQVDSETQEKVKESDKRGGGAPLNFCGPLVGAAAAAGAAAGGGGIGAGTVAAIVVAGGLLAGGLIFAFNGGGNPSPGTP
ncbi:MAG: hypothetical protein ABR557_08380 [Pyrinomonadaceae bacterium]